MSDIIPDVDEWNESTVVNNHLCRICLSLSDLLIPIFEGEGLEHKLFEKIVKYLPIKISHFDVVPQQICYECAGTLISWNSLYNTCLKADKKLQFYLGEVKSSELINLEVDSDDEPLMPPKKRKPEEIREEGSETETSLSINDSSRRKACNPKKVKKMNKLEEKISNKGSKKGNLNEADKSEPVAGSSKSGEDESCSLETEGFITEIKTECDSEEEEEEQAINNKEVNGDGEAVEESALIKCEFCEKSFKDKKLLNRHMKKFHNEAKSPEAQRCDLCGNIYKTRTNLERHYLKEHLTNQVQCPVCHASFNSKKLDTHLKSAHGVKTENENEQKFKCKLCEKWFKNKYVRNSHVKEVHLSEPVKCQLCDFEGVRTVLRRHRRDVHAEKRFLCSLCPGAFKTLHTLKMHMTSHSDIRCFTCDICGMGFKRLNNVRDHMKCHEEKSNQCQICGNFFARKRYLAIHEKTIHNFYADGVVPEEKGFECGTCGAKLKWKKNLLAHMRIHTGEKPYVCKICNKDFVCHGSLRTHMAKHSVCVLNEGDSQSHMSVDANVFNNLNPQRAN